MGGQHLAAWAVRGRSAENSIYLPACRCRRDQPAIPSPEPNPALSGCPQPLPAPTSTSIGVLEALTNQDILQRLQQLSGKLDQLASSKARPRRSRRHNRVLRPGSVLVAVTQVLVAADEPMRVHDISMAVSDLLGLPVSRSSVKNCLASKAQDEHGRFERTAHGCYRLRPSG